MTDYISETEYIMNIDKNIFFYFFLFLSANRYLGILKKHHRSDATLTTYASTLRVLIRAIGELKGKDAVLEDLNEDDIYKLIKMLPGKESTVKTKILILGNWMEFETGNNIPKRMKMLWNAEEPRRTFISKDQFDNLYSYAANDCERLIMAFGSQMGLRRAEIAKIKLDDIVGNSLIIHGKGHGKGKVVEKTIPAGLMRMIGAYIAGERKDIIEDETEQRLLLANSRNHRRGVPIEPTFIDNFYERLSRESGMKITSHVMRRLYCTLLADDAGLRSDLDTLRRMMRHESISTTLGCYLDADTKRIEKATERIAEVFDT